MLSVTWTHKNRGLFSLVSVGTGAERVTGERKIMSGQGRGIVRPGRGRGVRMRGGVQRRVGMTVTDEIRATIIDHVINHGLSLREAGERVQPNLRRSTVASFIRTFKQTNR